LQGQADFSAKDNLNPKGLKELLPRSILFPEKVKQFPVFHKIGLCWNFADRLPAVQSRPELLT